jgi:hypothetical protein
MTRRYIAPLMALSIVVLWCSTVSAQGTVFNACKKTSGKVKKIVADTPANCPGSQATVSWAGVPTHTIATASTALAFGFQQDLTISCPAGSVVVGGGAVLRASNNSTNVDAEVTESFPISNTTWRLHAHENIAATPLAYSWKIEGHAICLAF